jgi:hypothetical protein
VHGDLETVVKDGGKGAANTEQRKKVIWNLTVSFRCLLHKFSSESGMPELAKNYHETLQGPRRMITSEDEEEWAKRLEVIQTMPDEQKLKDPEPSGLNETLDEDTVARALKSAKLGTSARMNGIPYELWMTLHTRYEQRMKAPESEGGDFNIVDLLTKVYRNIQLHGVDETTEFALGWMYPIYKKGDRTEISNYRPITVLNRLQNIHQNALDTTIEVRRDHSPPRPGRICPKKINIFSDRVT